MTISLITNPVVSFFMILVPICFVLGLALYGVLLPIRIVLGMIFDF